jgi:IS30 family transposase
MRGDASEFRPRYECERVAKQESAQKPQPNESATRPGFSLTEVARQLGVTTSAIPRTVRRPGGE